MNLNYNAERISNDYHQWEYSFDFNNALTILEAPNRANNVRYSAGWNTEHFMF